MCLVVMCNVDVRGGSRDVPVARRVVLVGRLGFLKKAFFVVLYFPITFIDRIQRGPCS